MNGQQTVVNGIPTNDVSAFDRGIAYGDGLFETLALADNEILNWPRHMARLRHGCDILNIPPPDFEILAAEAHAVASGYDRSVIKMIVTRGSGGRGYTPPSALAPTRIVARHEWPDGYAERERQGVRVCIAQHRMPRHPQLAGLKHLNRLDQVLASLELVNSGAVEALMLDTAEFVIEATRCNLFIVRNAQLLTPRLDNCGVNGVMRSVILENAATLGLRAQELTLTLEDLYLADEIFLCNAIAGIWPVIEIDCPPHTFSIGETTRTFQNAISVGGYHR